MRDYTVRLLHSVFMNSFGIFNWLAVICFTFWDYACIIDLNYISKSKVLTPWPVGDLYRTVYKLAIELSV